MGFGPVMSQMISDGMAYAAQWLHDMMVPLGLMVAMGVIAWVVDLIARYYSRS